MKICKYILSIFCLVLTLAVSGQQPFTAGNIVVYRVGDGTAALDMTASVVYIDEYTPSGTLVQSIQMPTTGQKIMMPGGFADGGFMNLSVNGKYLVVPGFDVSAGTSFSTLTGINRSIGLIDCNGDVNSVTVVTNNPNTAPIFSATSDNGTNLWFNGNSAVEYITKGSSTSTLISSPASSYNINISDGQLFVSTQINASPMIQIGSGLPTSTGQTFTTLPGFPLRTRPRQFAFADLDPGVPGVDVVYLTSQNPLVPGGIQKYSLVGGNWVDNGQIGTTAESYSGLTIGVSAGTVDIYATRQGANSASIRGGELIRLTDNSGYNSTISGTPTVIASVSTPNTKAFRGIAMVPKFVPFTAGNIVVYRVGNGTGVLNNSASKVYLDEYSPSGALIQSILMPSSVQKLTMPGSLVDAGLMNLSADGKYLVVPGWDLNPGTVLTSAVGINKSIGLIDFNGAVSNITTVTNNPNSTPINSAVSDNGTNIWFNGNNAVEYIPKGGTTSTLVTSPASSYYINVSGGQLYLSTQINASPLVQIGTGLPITSGQTITTLPGFPLRTWPRQFAFADLDATVPGNDVVYLASLNPLSPGGIQKYSLVDGVWVSNGQIGTTAENYAGLTIKVSANTVSIFATRRGGNSAGIRGGELVKLEDNSGYNGTLTGVPTIIASVTTPDTKAFRGVAAVPLGCATVSGLQAPDISATQVRLKWNVPSDAGGTYEYAVTTSSVAPASGTITSNTSVTEGGLSNGVTYFAHVRRNCSAKSSSEWTAISFTTGCKPPPLSVVKINISPTGVIDINWNIVFGAMAYQYLISTTAQPPGSGIDITDTSIAVKNLSSVTQYYFHIRSKCSSGVFSDWITKPFNTACFVPTPQVTMQAKQTTFTWNKISNAVKYEYALTYNSAKPLGGANTTDTFYNTVNVNGKAPYFFHVRSYCSSGGVSDWNTVRLDLEGLQVYPNPVKESLNLKFVGVPNPDGEVTISNAMGSVVSRLKINAAFTTIDSRAWASGIYIVRYWDGHQQISVRIVKL